MPAPIGNQFWKLRSKHGRDKLFASPSLLWKAACEYFEHTDARKWVKKDWVGKDAFEVERETETPYTLTGLCLYLDCSDTYFNHFAKLLEGREDQESKDFIEIITRIRQICYTQKFEGAAVGAFNASIIARDLGLKEKTENELTGKEGKPIEHKVDITLNLNQ
jgi:hypothetical protein